MCVPRSFCLSMNMYEERNGNKLSSANICPHRELDGRAKERLEKEDETSALGFLSAPVGTRKMFSSA